MLPQNLCWLAIINIVSHKFALFNLEGFNFSIRSPWSLLFPNLGGIGSTLIFLGCSCSFFIYSSSFLLFSEAACEDCNLIWCINHMLSRDLLAKLQSQRPKFQLSRDPDSFYRAVLDRMTRKNGSKTVSWRLHCCSSSFTELWHHTWGVILAN